VKPVRAALLAVLLAGCATTPPTLPPPRWVPPPQWASCSDAKPCENVRKWLDVEKEAALARPACHPVPVKGSEAECARADSAYVAFHRENVDAFGALCNGAVGSNVWTVAPYFGTPESDRIATCGGKGGSASFVCRVVEWTWATPSRGGAFVIFLVQPEGAPPGVWAVNSCSYCENPGDCREFPLRR
jgi:hypothetical protein